MTLVKFIIRVRNIIIIFIFEYSHTGSGNEADGKRACTNASSVEERRQQAWRLMGATDVDITTQLQEHV